MLEEIANAMTSVTVVMVTEAPTLDMVFCKRSLPVRSDGRLSSAENGK